MTKPSQFTLNSDYLSLAQTSNNTLTAAFSGGTLPPSASSRSSVTLTKDFVVTTQAGAIDRFLISKDGGDYFSASEMGIEFIRDNSYIIVGHFRIYQASASTIRAELYLFNDTQESATYPSMTFNIKVSSFKPPNVF